MLSTAFCFAFVNGLVAQQQGAEDSNLQQANTSAENGNSTHKSPDTVQAATKLPDFVYKSFPVSERSDRSIHDLVRDAAQLVQASPERARPLIIIALEKVNRGAKIDLYDYLWTQYGLLKTSFKRGSVHFDLGNKKDYLKVAKNVIGFLDNETDVGQWVFTDLGAFQMAVYREAGNGLAWYTFEDTDDRKILHEALALINRAEQYVIDIEDYFVLDTKVRILLKLKKEKEAFVIVKQVLKEVPDFKDFEDFHSNIAYQSWLNSPTKITKITKKEE